MDQSDASQLLSSEECCEIIKKDFNSKHSNQIKLKTYQIKKCSNELVGFMGDYYKLETEIEDEVNK